MEGGEVEEGENTDSGDEEVGQIKASDDGGSSKSSYVAPDPLPRPNNPAMSYRAPQAIERGVELYVPSGESRTVDFDEFDAELSEAAARIGADQLWNVNDDGEPDNHSTRKRAGKKNGIKHRLDIHPGRGGGGDDDYYDELPAEVCADDDERVIARYIARNLNEPKIVLIERVVRYTSRQKALDLFNRTMDVEAAGGMKTIRGDTRRTPGGVFLQLLKTDKNITKDMVKEIFSLERENQKFAKKMNIKDRQNRKRKYRNKNNTSESLQAPPTDLIDDSDLMGEEPDIEIGVVS